MSLVHSKFPCPAKPDFPMTIQYTLTCVALGSTDRNVALPVNVVQADYALKVLCYLHVHSVITGHTEYGNNMAQHIFCCCFSRQGLSV